MKRSTVSFARISRVVFSVGVAVVIGALAVPTEAAPVSINTPAGLNPGDRFRIAFVTGATTTGSSSDITSYNLFVNTAAGGATYNGSAVTFYAIGSTATVNAYDNIRSTTMNDPVYLAGGALVAPSITGANGLWSGALVNRIATGIDGTVVSPNGNGNDVYVYTGSLVDGTASSEPLGYLFPGDLPFDPPVFETSTGKATGGTDAAWIRDGGGSTATFSRSLYGISETLTVAPVPEPSTCAMALAGLACGGYSLFRRRKRA
jgi:PEP-CTERM motif